MGLRRHRSYPHRTPFLSKNSMAARVRMVQNGGIISEGSKQDLFWARIFRDYYASRISTSPLQRGYARSHPASGTRQRIRRQERMDHRGYNRKALLNNL